MGRPPSWKAAALEPAAETGPAQRLGDSELVPRVGTQCVVPHQLHGHAFSRIGIQPPGPMQRSELPSLAFRVPLELALLALDIRELGVALRADRDVLARGHRKRTGEQDAVAGSLGRRNAEHHTCR